MGAEQSKDFRLLHSDQIIVIQQIINDFCALIGVLLPF